ncbi:MAG: IscS subfamily cysteine desulfurase, partial [Clostridia bacterium]|nr:IscS subfamily cysteine desulfurase [Clostridia bacterium]
MKMSTKARYGLYACIKLAEKYGDNYHSIIDVANEINVSDGYLEQIIAKLKKDNIVISQRGSMGGYKLSDSPENISVGRVLRSVEDNLEIVDCINSDCKSQCSCVSRVLWQNLYNQINLYLDGISLQQLLDSAQSNNKVYLDHAATTPLDQDVLQAMLPYMTDVFGNSHSQHFFGRDAMAGVDKARQQVATALNAKPSEIYFVGSGTEADNWALKGIALQRASKGKHIIVSAIEHHAVLNSAEWLKSNGFEVTLLPVDQYGVVTPKALEEAIRPDTTLVSIMYANNEVGTIQPIEELAKVVKKSNAVFHVDAVQAVGSIPIDVKQLDVDLLSLSAHKFYGPKGVAALYIKNGLSIQKFIVGGGQERSMRGGTTNTAGVVGMGYAIQKATRDLEKNNEYVKSLRDAFVKRVLEEIPYVRYNGHPTQRLPSNASFSFEFIEGESILMLLDFAKIAVSSGSACSSGSLEPSHVLLAMGVPVEVSHGTIRFSFGKHNT